MITDSPQQIKSKISSALTDSIPGISYDKVARPGISNLLDILSIFDTDARSSSQLANDYNDLSPRQLKDMVSDAVILGLNGIRDRYSELLGSDQNYLDKIEHEGARKARENAAETMTIVREAMGMGTPSIT